MAEITWIKLKTDMFNDEKIKLIERMPEGDGILIIWVKLLAYAGKVNCSGYIMIAEDIPMNIEEMAIIFNRPFEKVRYAIQILQRYKMIEVDAEERVCITNWEKHQNIDGMEHVKRLNAERQKKHREKKKLTQLPAPNEENNVTSNVTDDVTVTQCHATEVEVDIEVDKDKDKELITTTTDKNALRFFQENVRFNLSTFEIETILHWENEYPYELIIEAMKRTALANVNSLRYVESILIDWQKKRITTLGEIFRDDEQFDQKKRKGGATRGSYSQGNQQLSNPKPDEFSL